MQSSPSSLPSRPAQTPDQSTGLSQDADLGATAPEPSSDEALRRTLGAIDQQYKPQTDVPRRIHVVGTGNIGNLVAHSLRSLPDPPPVTMIFHKYSMLEAWEKSKRVITIQDGDRTDTVGGLDVELSDEIRRVHGKTLATGGTDPYDLAEDLGIKVEEAVRRVEEQQRDRSEQEIAEAKARGPKLRGQHAMSNEPIYNLIVGTKTIRTTTALLRLKPRITKETTICLLQNGMGMVDELNEKVFTDEETRPKYIQGIVTHGANVPLEKKDVDPFYVIHAGHGTIALGAVPPLLEPGSTPSQPYSSTEAGDEEDTIAAMSSDQLAPSGRYLLRTLTRSPVLCAVALTPIELLQQQLEKLAVNSVLNPMTALLDHRNGSLLYNFALSRAQRILLAEISLVIRSLPELQGIPNVPHRFSASRLETLVIGVAGKTARNISSTLADVRNGQQTELEYINGYIVKRGEELGIKCVVNYTIMQLVIGKALMTQRERLDEIPLEGDKMKQEN